MSCEKSICANLKGQKGQMTYVPPGANVRAIRLVLRPPVNASSSGLSGRTRNAPPIHCRKLSKKHNMPNESYPSCTSMYFYDVFREREAGISSPFHSSEAKPN